MNDEQLTRLFHSLEVPDTPEPAFADALFDDLQRTVSRPERRMPATWVLVAAAMLLALAVGTALAVGSGMVRLPWQSRRDVPIEQPVFGVAQPCDPQYYLSTSDELVLLVKLRDRVIRLGTDGELVVIRPPDAVRHATYLHQHLAPSGVHAMVERVEAAGILPGCREPIRSRLGEATIYLRVDGEPSSLSLSATAVRQATPMEETALETLFGDLRDPTQWLAPSDLADGALREFTPDTWLLVVDELRNTEPGEGGTNAGLVELPEGETLGTYGLVIGTEPEGPSTSRCETLTSAQADRVEASLTEAGAFAPPDPSDNLWEIGAPGNVDYMVALYPAVPGALDCMQRRAANAGLDSSPTERPIGDLVEVDACGLLPQDWSIYPVGVAQGLQFDVRSFACSAERPSSDWWGDVASVTVRGASTTRIEAEWWANALFGEGLTRERVGDRTLWFNACAVENLDCPSAVAVLDVPYFYVLEYRASTTPSDGSDGTAPLRELVMNARIGQSE